MDDRLIFGSDISCPDTIGLNTVFGNHVIKLNSAKLYVFDSDGDLLLGDILKEYGEDSSKTLFFYWNNNKKVLLVGKTK